MGSYKIENKSHTFLLKREVPGYRKNLGESRTKLQQCKSKCCSSKSWNSLSSMFQRFWVAHLSRNVIQSTDSLSCLVGSDQLHFILYTVPGRHPMHGPGISSIMAIMAARLQQRLHPNHWPLHGHWPPSQSDRPQPPSISPSTTCHASNTITRCVAYILPTWDVALSPPEP